MENNNPKFLTTSRLIRCIGLVWCFIALFALTVQLLEFYYYFDPNYLGDFLVSKLMKPIVGLGFGLILFLGANPLSKLIK